MHLLNKWYLVDIGKFTLLIFNSIPSDIDTKYIKNDYLSYVFLSFCFYVLMQLVIQLPVVKLLTAPNGSNKVFSKSNHNQQLDQLVSGILKHHSKLKLVVYENLPLKTESIILFVARDFDFLPLLLLQNKLLSILPYLPVLDIRVRLARLPLVLNCFMTSNRRREWFKVLEDEFDVDELIRSLVCLRSRFRNTSFNGKHC